MELATWAGVIALLELNFLKACAETVLYFFFV